VNRKLYEAVSALFLIIAWVDAGLAVARGIPTAWLLFIAPTLVYAVITFTQRLPATSLNLTVKVTPANAERIEPVVRDFLATLKAVTMMFVSFVINFSLSRMPLTLFFFVEGSILLLIFAQLFGFLRKIKKLA
jgi:hypothetical protein